MFFSAFSRFFKNFGFFAVPAFFPRPSDAMRLYINNVASSSAAAARRAVSRTGGGFLSGGRIHGARIVPLRLPAAIGAGNPLGIHFDQLLELLSALFALVL